MRPLLSKWRPFTGRLLEELDLVDWETVLWTLVSLVDDLNGRDGCVVHKRVKRQVELPFRCGPQMVESLREGVKATDFLEDVEVIEQCCAVAIDSKDAASNSDLS